MANSGSFKDQFDELRKKLNENVNRLTLAVGAGNSGKLNQLIQRCTDERERQTVGASCCAFCAACLTELLTCFADAMVALDRDRPQLEKKVQAVMKEVQKLQNIVEGKESDAAKCIDRIAELTEKSAKDVLAELQRTKPILKKLEAPTHCCKKSTP